MSNHITLTRVNYTKPELRHTATGKPVLSFRVCDQKRRYNETTQQWEDASEPLWLNVTMFNRVEETHQTLLAEPKPKLTIVGELRSETYQAKDGTQATAIKVIADHVTTHPRTTQTTSAQPAYPPAGQWQTPPSAQPMQPVQPGWGQPAYPPAPGQWNQPPTPAPQDDAPPF